MITAGASHRPTTTPLLHCHPERSEGSLLKNKILRFAQNDRAEVILVNEIHLHDVDESYL